MRPRDRFDILASGRLVRLRRKRLEDAGQDYAWQSDPELARLEGRAVLSEPYHDYLRRYQANLEFPPSGTVQLAIEDADRRYVGTLVVYNIDRGMCEFGIGIGDEDGRGRGYGGDAICTFLGWAWGSLGMTVVYAHTLAWNQRARRALESCGMRAAARVERAEGTMIRYEARREWWLMENERSPFPRTGQPGGAAVETSL